MGGGEGGERMERRLSRRACTERECHTYTHTWGVCVCVCMCVSEQKGKPPCSTGGGLGDRMAIHSQRHGVCVCVCMAKGKTILFHRCPPVEQDGFPFCHHTMSLWVLLPPWPARTVENHKTAGVGGGDAAGTDHKTAVVGEGDAAEAEGYPVPQGGGGENIYT